MRLPLLILHNPRWKHRLAHRHRRYGCAQWWQRSPRIRQRLHRGHADPGHQRLLPSHPAQQGNIAGSVGTFYLIGTAWLAGRRGERTRLIDWSALFIGLAGAVAAIALGVYTLHNPGGVDKTTAPAGMSFLFGHPAARHCRGHPNARTAEFQAGSASLGTCGACAMDSSLRQGLSSWGSSKFSRPSCAAPYS